MIVITGLMKKSMSAAHPSEQVMAISTDVIPDAIMGDTVSQKNTPP